MFGVQLVMPIRCMNLSISRIKGMRGRIDEAFSLEEKIMMEKA